MTGGENAIQEAPKYLKEELLVNAGAIFNVKAEVIAGALHGYGQTEFTVDEMHYLVDLFLKRKVE